jgi:G3E family GTPase
VVINAVQHLVHPPIHLQAWPEDGAQSGLVFIVRDLPRADIERSFAAFHALLADETARRLSDPAPACQP